MLVKEEPFVRRQAAAALGQIGDKRAAGPLVEAAARPADRFLEHSILYSLIQLGDAPVLLAALKHPSPLARKAGLIALDQMRGGPIRANHVLAMVTANEPELRRAALWVISRHPAWSPELARTLATRLREAKSCRRRSRDDRRSDGCVLRRDGNEAGDCPSAW
jgi:hypothetical protein